jgi:hypothetical protein
MGSSLKMLTWGREQLQTQADVLSTRVAETEGGNEELLEDKKS